MGNDHNRNAMLLIELFKNCHDFTAGLRIEIAGGFVGKYQWRIIDQRAADGDALLLPPDSWVG